VAYASGNEILSRYFVWKQSRQGLLNESTRSLFLVSEVLGVVESDSGVANAVLEDFADGLRAISTRNQRSSSLGKKILRSLCSWRLMVFTRRSTLPRRHRPGTDAQTSQP
jgi:hypothetical protein